MTAADAIASSLAESDGVDVDVQHVWSQLQAAPARLRINTAAILLDDARPQLRALALPLLEHVVHELREKQLPPVLCEGLYCALSVRSHCRKFAVRKPNDGRTWITVAPTAQGPPCKAFEGSVARPLGVPMAGGG